MSKDMANFQKKDLKKEADEGYKGKGKRAIYAKTYKGDGSKTKALKMCCK